LPRAWAAKAASSNPEGPNPAHFTWYMTDTPGLSDTRGQDADEANLKEMTETLRRKRIPVNVIVLMMQITNPRFSPPIKKSLKILDAFFNNPNTWDQVCIVATNVSSDTQESRRNVFRGSNPRDKKSVRALIIDLLHQLHD
jgi:hypothetical protein